MPTLCSPFPVPITILTCLQAWIPDLGKGKACYTSLAPKELHISAGGTSQDNSAATTNHRVFLRIFNARPSLDGMATHGVGIVGFSSHTAN